MGASITTSHDYVILDACCVMNLYASGRMEEIIASIAETITIAVYVMKVETLTVYTVSKTTALNERETIDLNPLIAKGLLVAVDLRSNKETATFVELTTYRLDDGEAITMAIAVNRNWAVATDDRRAKHVLNMRHESIQTISTPEIIKHWQENRKPKADILRQTIIDIERKANFLLGSRHPLYEWWQACKE